MKYKKLLISGLGGSLFPYLHHKLKSAGYETYYVDNNENLKRIYPDLNFFYAPKASDGNYSEFINGIIEKYGIDVYIPLIDEELIQAKSKEIAYEERDLVVVTPAVAFLQLCLNKHRLMMELAASGLSVIETYKGDQFSWQIPAPVFVKPISGRGSRGVMHVANEAELAAYYILEKYKPEDVIIQPFISGIEYTVGVVTNAENQLLSVSSKKVISKKGITISAVTENNPQINDIAAEITKKFKPRGPFNIQLFITPESQIKIFEINPRFSTTLVLSYQAGVDELTLYLNNINGYTGPVIQPEEDVHLYRLWNNIFY